MLAKSMFEKEQAQVELKNRGQSLEALSAKLRMRDEESLRKDEMFRSLEQQLAQKDHQQATIVDQTRDRLYLLQREITYREQEVQNLRHRIKEKEMQADAALDKACALVISSETLGSGEWPPSCKFHGPSPARRRL